MSAKNGLTVRFTDVSLISLLNYSSKQTQKLARRRKASHESAESESEEEVYVSFTSSCIVVPFI